MPLLDIATPQPSFKKQPDLVRLQTFYHVLCRNGNNSRFGSSWGFLHIPSKANNTEMWGGGRLMIKAVAVLEPRYFDKENDNAQQLEIDTTRSLPATENQNKNEDSMDLDEKEKLRRKRISKANRGNVPWNKGRKHSPETLQRIRERTRIAMQDPKVRMKLSKAVHTQSEETKTKIGHGVRMGWVKRREKLVVQETCLYEWQNLIAEASRRGLYYEEELQWHSYEIMDEQLQQEWRENIEIRKIPKPKANRRAPKTPEQRRKISEAIAAKWNDPLYRDRVSSGLAKYHDGVAKPRRVASDREPRKNSSSKKRYTMDDFTGKKSKNKSQRAMLRRSNEPTFKDPEASSKLEMIRRIRAQRAAADPRKSEAITRAKLMIAEAERATDALERVAAKSPVAEASLHETKKLIAEAIKVLESVETGDVQSLEIGNETDKDDMVVDGLSHMGDRGVNGVGSDAEIMEFGLSKPGFQDDDDLLHAHHENALVNGKEHIHTSASSNDLGLPLLEMGSLENQLDELIPSHGHDEFEFMQPNELESGSNEKQETHSSRSNDTKKWVCGKLVEVDEYD